MSISIHDVRFHVSDSCDAVAWDHRLASHGKCTRISAVRNSEGALVEASAQLAQRLETHGVPRRRIRMLDVTSVRAYEVADVHDLLWLSAHMLAPAGLRPEPQIVLDQPEMTFVTCAEVTSVSLKGAAPEYRHLSLSPGNWLLSTGGEDPQLRALSATQMGRLLAGEAVDPADVDSAWGEIEAA